MSERERVLGGGPARISLRRGVAVPMPDGTRLATNVVAPDDGAPRPCLLLRTPYGRETTQLLMELDVLRGARAGFCVVTQDVRGRFDSEGPFDLIASDGPDGAATLRWLRAQPWCNGRVGMLGMSYGSVTTLCALAAAPDLLDAFVTQMGGPIFETVRPGGVLQLEIAAGWPMSLAATRVEQQRRAGTLDDATAEYVEALRHRPPLEQFHALCDAGSPLRRLAAELWDWYATDEFDDGWARWDFTRTLRGTSTPGLHIAGWYDLLLENDLGLHRAIVDAAPRPAHAQHLLVGPWSHDNMRGVFADEHFGAEAVAFDLIEQQLRFFDRYLNGASVELAPVRTFVMGANRWHDEDAWPPRGVRPLRFYLRREDPAADGRLALEPPGDEPPDAYRHDPRDPVPTVGGANLSLGGANAGPRDQAGIARRADVLSYTSAPLERPLHVAGAVELRLFASSDAPETDFVVKLVDVAPDGVARLVCDGVLGTAYREGRTRTAPLEPDRVYELRIRIGSTNRVFGAGHRLRVHVASSDVPRYYPNPGTGHRIADGPPREWRVARQRVWHDAAHASHLLLSVL